MYARIAVPGSALVRGDAHLFPPRIRMRVARRRTRRHHAAASRLAWGKELDIEPAVFGVPDLHFVGRGVAPVELPAVVKSLPVPDVPVDAYLSALRHRAAVIALL